MEKNSENQAQIEIVNYSPAYKEAIKELNYEWLQKYFAVEPSDEVSLSNPQEEIIDKGGFIYFAKLNNEVVGTASLLQISDTVYELGKMAVSHKAQGYGIGTLLVNHAINESKNLNIEKLILYSNRQLEAALHLYNKFGFQEIDLEEGFYDRADIKMELFLGQ